MERGATSLAVKTLRSKYALAGAAVFAVWWATTASVPAGQERSPDRERCADVQGTESRERCEHPWSRVEQNFSVLTDPNVCGRDRDGCHGGDGHTMRSPRPPYWIGHHYSGL